MVTASGRALRVTGVAGADEPAILVVEDVTAQLRREQAVQEFVHNAAHQLRTPLTAIATAVEVLQSGAKDVPADRDRFLEHVARHTARLSRIARGLLALARAQSGEPLRLRPVPIGPMLARLETDSTPVPGVRIVAAPAKGVHALAEPDLLEEALAELVENAIAHTQSGEIHLSAMPAGDVVAIDIADTGEGIPPEHRGLIFEPFYRTETGGNGFGLGLAIVAQAVLAMGGTIEAVEVPRGAHLSIKLPATPPGGG
jgi:signal transduction histidine kinase